MVARKVHILEAVGSNPTSARKRLTPVRRLYENKTANKWHRSDGGIGRRSENFLMLSSV